MVKTCHLVAWLHVQYYVPKKELDAVRQQPRPFRTLRYPVLKREVAALGQDAPHPSPED
jgi:hypothetical protein